ncbi:hypothetical protein [Nocardia sp. NPDC051463]|uniref:hypothetical protein n=1 Tax=Nocardia sp. NPDC051463 TaxID=3154845 RepID=UPI00343E86ED
MEPERNSPYWNAIVGNKWPEIPPSDWSALETTAREGAAAIDLLEIDQYRRAFDDRVRSSVGLQAVKDDMLRQRAHPQAFADALNAAADTFGHFSDLVYRTRNQILDIVERATSRAESASRAAENTEDKEEAEAARARIPGIIAAAKAEVEDVARTALGSISPSGLPSLAVIADVLGMPGPWEKEPQGGSGGPGRSGRPGRPADRHGHRPATEHPGKHDDDDDDSSAPRRPGPARPWPLDPMAPKPRLDDIVGLPEHQAQDRPISDVDTADRPADAPAAGAPVLQASNVTTPHTTSPSGSTTATTPVMPVVGHDGHADAAGSGSPRPHVVEASPESPGAAHDTDDADAPGSPLATGASRTRDETAGASATGPQAGAVPTDALIAAGLAMADADSAPPMALPLVTAPGASPGSSVSIPAAQSGSSAQGTQSGSGIPQSPARPTTPAAESKAPSVVPKVSAGVSAPAPSTAAPGAKSQPANRDEANRDDQRADAEPTDTGGSNELVRDAVGAAMTFAAAPSFVLGDRVDGDLVLARTILSGVLAAVDASVVGIGWAVSVMRHSGGISAFVTSNEGRGWLPAGLYLPRGVSTPWVWEVAEGSGWEGVADPARVLAEFALAWGRKSGANLAALASSEPIDVNMRRQLGDVPSAGEVGASSAMDLSAPRAGLVDRLGLVGAPALLDRAAATTAAEFGRRCMELATDAHVRLGQSGLGSVEAFGAPGLRERILLALGQGRQVLPDWWDELRDADDLLAATMLAHRADVSAVALGELRSEQSADRSGLTILRGMMFERRCDELVLLLENPPTRQSLRDVMYTHAQIVGHPFFGAPTSPGPAPDTTVVRRPTITAGPGR